MCVTATRVFFSFGRQARAPRRPRCDRKSSGNFCDLRPCLVFHLRARRDACSLNGHGLVDLANRSKHGDVRIELVDSGADSDTGRAGRERQRGGDCRDARCSHRGDADSARDGCIAPLETSKNCFGRSRTRTQPRKSLRESRRKNASGVRNPCVRWVLPAVAARVGAAFSIRPWIPAAEGFIGMPPSVWMTSAPARSSSIARATWHRDI
jgi:hypothetical protein